MNISPMHRESVERRRIIKGEKYDNEVFFGSVQAEPERVNIKIILQRNRRKTREYKRKYAVRKKPFQYQTALWVKDSKLIMEKQERQHGNKKTN